MQNLVIYSEIVRESSVFAILTVDERTTQMNGSTSEATDSKPQTFIPNPSALISGSWQVDEVLFDRDGWC